MMRHSRAGIVYIVLAIVAMLAVVGVRSPVASAQGSASCPDEATIASLQACVQHAAQAGLIDNQGVVQSLLVKLNAAQAAADRGQPGVAAHAVQAFSYEVLAQRGKHIDAEHADHMLTHAQLVMQALGESQ